MEQFNKVQIKNAMLEDLIKFSKTVRVLYVENNDKYRKNSFGVFKVFFHKIDTAKDGLEGFNYFENNKYDLIITSIDMPNMNGIDMITKIREISKNITILITSSNNKNFIDLIRLGIDGYILKPVEISQFTSIMQKVIEKLHNKEELYQYKNHLEQKIEEKINKIKSLNDNLETRVKEEILKNKEKDNILIQQSKMAAMGEMLENIAHQWRQPLSVISTAATGIIMQREFDIIDEQQELKTLNTINDSAQFLSKTIDDFRNFFKDDKNKSTFNLKDVYIISYDILSSKFKNNYIKIVQDIENVNIKGFDGEITQVIMNLLNNASDVLLSKEKQKMYIFVNIYKDTNNAILEVKDNAGGVPSDIIDRVFEPYFTTKHKSQGTGIGLYMCQKMIVDHMGGSIEVKNMTYEYDNNTFKGACFRIKLPLA